MSSGVIFYYVKMYMKLSPRLGFSDFVKMNTMLTEQLFVLGGSAAELQTQKKINTGKADQIPCRCLTFPAVLFLSGGLLSDPSTDKKHQS
jgi:hypothetical protein